MQTDHLCPTNCLTLTIEDQLPHFLLILYQLIVSRRFKKFLPLTSIYVRKKILTEINFSHEKAYTCLISFATNAFHGFITYSHLLSSSLN